MSEIAYERLNPKCMTDMYVSHFIKFTILVILYLIITHFFTIPRMFDTLYLSALVIILIYILVAPIVFYKFYRYTITSERVEIMKGLMVVRHTLLPLERIHQVDVKTGPVDSLFGLAKVEMTTAGGIVKILFLEKNEADLIVRELNLLISRMIAGRKKDD